MAKPINGNQIKPMVDTLFNKIIMYTLITMSLLHIYLLLLPRSLFLSKRVGYDKNFAAVVMSHTTKGSPPKTGNDDRSWFNANSNISDAPTPVSTSGSSLHISTTLYTPQSQSVPPGTFLDQIRGRIQTQQKSHAHPPKIYKTNMHKPR